MPRLDPPDEETLAEIQPAIDAAAEMMGFVPNSLLLMARTPAVAKAFGALAAAVFSPENSSIDGELKLLVAHIASSAAGCSYCRTHTAHVASERGAAIERIEHAWEFETSDLFTEAERAALTLARDAALIPNAATDQHFHKLLEHYSPQQITEIVSVIAMYGFLNRWNDTLATELEASPLAFGEAHLKPSGWQPATSDENKS